MTILKMEVIKERKESSLHARKVRSRLYEELVVKSWWALLFFFICFFAFDRASAFRKHEIDRLKKKEVELQIQLHAAQDQLEVLELQKAGGDDPAWIELTLKRKLGLVPEGETKILFQPERL